MVLRRKAVNSRRATLWFAVLAFWPATAGADDPIVTDARNLPPREALQGFVVPEGFEMELVASEPAVRQPLYMSFDERGRLWVVQYLQYPFPAGMKVVSHDQFWRVKYDRVSPPPPNQFRGRDKITIFEDTDGDGTFDTHKDFQTGLNIATAVLTGRGGVWVLNPPYLLFYPDRDRDDVPDSDPHVHLSGFGLEDTHAVASSLRWGPDGWIYGAQGSTTTATILRPGIDREPPVHFKGHAIWRYHPETRRFEVFAEGGGNTFAVAMDRKGRIFAGANGAAVGYHYVQGGAYLKNWGKHGNLMNPYSFGWMPRMTHYMDQRTSKLSQPTTVYEADSYPPNYRGRIFIGTLKVNQVEVVKRRGEGSSYSVEKIQGEGIRHDDRAFRPVDLKVGPDGSVYIADWYDFNINHRGTLDETDSTSGRIYRFRYRGSKLPGRFDLAALPSEQLVREYLSHPNMWFRHTALRVLGDRRDRSVVGMLAEMLEENEDDGQLALETLWALNLCGGFDDGLALRTLDHPDPHVRMWTVRLLGDRGAVPEELTRKLAALARVDTHAQVRSQLASSARRLPGPQALPIMVELLRHGEDVGDPQIPLLLWWALESKATSDRQAVLALFQDHSLWKEPLVEEHILERLMRRYASAGGDADPESCARLLELSPGPRQSALLMKGLELAFQGRRLGHLPPALARALGEGTLVLRLRQEIPAAVKEALGIVLNEKAPAEERLELIRVFGEINQPECVPVLLQVFPRPGKAALRRAALNSLQQYDDLDIGLEVIRRYAHLEADVQAVARTVLTTRHAWALQFLRAIDGGQVDASTISADVIQQLRPYGDGEVARMTEKLWPSVRNPTAREKEEQIAKLARVISTGTGSAVSGKSVFLETARCGTCHRLFKDGNRVGPDLTAHIRDSVESLLHHIVDPSATIENGYVNYVIMTRDGRALSGFLVAEDHHIVTLRGMNGQDTIVQRDQIEIFMAQESSVMPEGLLDPLSREQVRDLFAFIRETPGQ